ncbi:MAG: nitroreductase family protein [Actinobacteria bacterium]|nr:nitroreductase family protein [Actinomycetota bacterium]
MTLELSIDDLLTTTRSVRKRLDLERPVPRDVVEECLGLALQAPTGGNTQGWHWVVVEDAEKKRAIAEVYGRFADPYFAASEQLRGWPEGDPRAASAPKVGSSARYLREHLHEVPLMVIPCQWGRPGPEASTAEHAGFWGSILPAAWSFMLALRSRGLGSAWTTLHLPGEQEVAELLGIPYEKVAQAGLFPVAYTKGTDFRPADRLPLERVLHWDTW